MSFLRDASIILVAALILSSCSGPADNVRSTTSLYFNEADVSTVAVYFHSSGSGRYGSERHFRRCIEDEFMKWLIAYGYSVPARSDKDAMIRELNLQHSDITDRDATEIGRFLNVQGVLVIGCDFDRNTMSARLIDVRSSEVLWMAGLTEYSRVWYQAYQIARKIPPRKVVPNVEGILKCTQSSRLDLKQIRRIGIYVDDARLLDTGAAEDRVMMLCMDRGLGVPSRSDMHTVLAELKLQASDITTGDMAELGKALNVDAMLTVHANSRQVYRYEAYNSRTQKYYTVTSNVIGFGLRLIDVKTSDVLWISTSYGVIIDPHKEKSRIVEILTDALGCFPMWQ